GVRIGHPPKVDGDQLAVEDAADAAVDTIACIPRMAGDEELRGQQLAVAALDLEVDVRAAAGIGNRLDGAKAILALLVRGESAEALEVAVTSAAAVGAGVQVDAVAVDLPDLNDEIVESGAAGREHPAGEVGDFADGGRGRVADDDQVVVGVERQA